MKTIFHDIFVICPVLGRVPVQGTKKEILALQDPAGLETHIGSHQDDRRSRYVCSGYACL